MNIAKHIILDEDLEKKFTAYRKQRKLETGKVLHLQTAIRELLTKALAGVDPEATEVHPLEARVAALEARVQQLDGSVIGDPSQPPPYVMKKVAETGHELLTRKEWIEAASVWCDAEAFGYFATATHYANHDDFCIVPSDAAKTEFPKWATHVLRVCRR